MERTAKEINHEIDVWEDRFDKAIRESNDDLAHAIRLKLIDLSDELRKAGDDDGKA